MDAAILADFPADGHALEEIVFENKVARVISFGKKAVLVESFGADGVLDDIALDVFESEFALGESGEVFHPVGDGELPDGNLFWHDLKIISRKRSA